MQLTLEETVYFPIGHKLNRLYRELDFARNHITKFKTLTLREKEIIRLLSKGRSNPEIANQLYISRRTVEQHRKNINRKLNVHRLPEVITFAYAFDLV